MRHKQSNGFCCFWIQIICPTICAADMTKFILVDGVATLKPILWDSLAITVDDRQTEFSIKIFWQRVVVSGVPLADLFGIQIRFWCTENKFLTTTFPLVFIDSFPKYVIGVQFDSGISNWGRRRSKRDIISNSIRHVHPKCRSGVGTDQDAKDAKQHHRRVWFSLHVLLNYVWIVPSKFKEG